MNDNQRYRIVLVRNRRWGIVEGIGERRRVFEEVGQRRWWDFVGGIGDFENLEKTILMRWSGIIEK